MGFRNSLLAACVLLAPLAAHTAPARDALVDGARLCTQQFPIQERQQRIPNHLLAAISSTETGRWHKELGMALPWPWTINVEGKGYYLNSKAEAIATVQQHMRNGARSIDVGCMQVNLKHHSKAFANLEQAFDPAANVGYAAKFLRTNYDDLGDWIKATAAYHSRTPKYGNAYLTRIEKNWSRIVTKVAEARRNQGLAPQPAMQADFAVAQTPATKRMNPISSTRNVKIIQVGDTPRRSSEVMVVRSPTQGAPSNSPIRVADAREPAASDMIVNVPAASGVDSAPASGNSAGGSSGPKFVFAN